MNNSSTNNDPQRLEQIVAYLDGELSPVDEALIQRQLAEDESFRREVQSMEQAWSILDALPGVTVDDKFSQTTMQMVVGAAKQDLTAQTVALPIQHRNQWLAKMLLFAATAALGWLVVQLVRENPNRTLLANLPEIEYIDIYSQFQDVAFLRALHVELGDTPWATELTDADLADRVLEYHAIATPTDREQWLTELEVEERVALRSRYNHFLAVSSAEQSHLRDLHASITNDNDSEQLIETLLAYQAWLNTLPASQQFELREMPADERVREIVNVQRREAANNWIDLSAEEVQQLRRVLLELRKQFMDSMSSQQRDRFEAAGVGGRWIAMTRQFPELRGRWRTSAGEVLSADKLSEFEALTVDEQEKQLLHWMRDVTMRDPRERGPGKRPRFDQVSQEELERFFAEELDATTRERLLAQPRDRMEQQLKYLYLRGEWPNYGENFSERDRLGPPGRERLGPGPPRRGEPGGFGPPRRGGPPEDRPGFGRPPRREGGPRPDGPPPRPDDDF
ncbi:anti-sigma factor family protein [Bythopirellula polymerisocia]|uniref:Zinc-finger domain-containing protein n=1 Tax=Bythopirellula polymerisocia TaxID=2528003 RepID=A0A5C6D381_9BACT|nr:hypothetical protein [Bythopirellula polymerisocia]TWU30314.1 hypothetical protein Pla144_11000 [Bythopirellula polymerisocia]